MELEIVEPSLYLDRAPAQAAMLADAVLATHGLFVLFVVLGGFLVLVRPRLAWLHLPAAVWGALIEFAGWICPLTYLENWLRRRGDEPVTAPPELLGSVDLCDGQGRLSPRALGWARRSW